MKDPHIGVWGTLGIVLLVLAKFELLQILPMREKIFLLAMTASRWAQVVLSFFLPYVRPEGGLGESVAGKLDSPKLLGATVFLLGVIVWTGWAGLWIFAGLLVFLFLLGIFFKKKLGGVTGDLFGASSELTELFVFLFACVFFGASHA